ncbi:MAG: EAL domain-containing protein [Eubacterium sp.]
MEWHIDYEIFSLIIIVVLMFYYIRGKYLPTWQNRIYIGMLVTFFCFVFVNIIATVCLIYFNRVDILLTCFFNNLYLVFLPMTPTIVFLYVVSIVRPDIFNKKRSLILMMLPFFVCVLFSISNPITHIMFSITPENAYQPGKGYYITNGIFFLYAIMILGLIIKNKKAISNDKRIAVFGFLATSAFAVILQQIFKGYLLNGSACALTALFIHLSMQNQGLTVDELTGAYKRQVLLQMLELHFKIGDDNAIIAVALRDFKFANEVFGIKTCDKLLKEVVEYLESVSPTGRVYRFDGDIFCIAVHGEDKKEGIERVEIIKERFKKPWHLQGINYALSCNLAKVSYNKTTSENVEEIVAAIDFSIQEAKRYNGERIIRGDEVFSARFKKKNHIKAMLLYALENDGFEIYYQPIYDIKDGCYKTCEALIRMNDPEYGLVAPDEFIPITEENGMIVSIGLIVFEKVCQFLTKNPYLSAGFENVGVNLSVVQCMQESLADDLIAIMDKYKLPPQYFKFEITETVAAGSMQILKNTMDKLIKNGSHFALDDFGTGYAGVSNMLTLPFKFIKLDKSLVDKMTVDYRMAIAVETMITLIHRLKMKVIAEGVERKEEVNRLGLLKCDLIQGYYFSKPLPEAEFVALVNRLATQNNDEH